MKKVITSYLFIFCILELTNSIGQITHLDNIGTSGSSTDYVGWDGTATFPLLINNKANFAIEFYTNGGNRAKIGNSSEFSLIVGDGSTTLFNNIDIQVVGNTPATEGYRYDGNLILCAPGADNLLCGLAAGSNVTGSENTLIGSLSGNSISTANSNSFTGAYSGYSNNGDQNTFSGAYSGFLNTIGQYNAFSGAYSGTSNGEGNYNAFFGAYAGANNTDASNNTFIGFSSGANNFDGERNTFSGTNSGSSNSDGHDNTFIGFESGKNNISGLYNTFSGSYTGHANTAWYNTFYGFKSGFNNSSGEGNTFIGESSGLNNTTANYNTFTGFESGKTNTTGAQNTFNGNQSGLSNTTGEKNSFLGSTSGYGNTTGNRNSFFGSAAGNGNTTGSDNSYFGYFSGSGMVTNSYNNTCLGAWSAQHAYSSRNNTIVGFSAMYNMYGGDRNTVTGSNAGYSFDVGDDNTFIGYQTGTNNASGNSNTFLGINAGQYNISGSNNTYLGSNSGQQSGGSHTLQYSVTIGANAIVRNSKHMILGDNDIYVGIGLSNDVTGPRDKLEIKSGTTGVSGLQFTDLLSSYVPSSTASKFLTVESDGKVILRDIPGGGGSVTACNSLTPTSDVGFISKWSAITTTPNVKEIFKSQIYDNGTEVGVNYGASPPSGVKFSVNGDVNIAASHSYDINQAPFLKTNGYDIELGINTGPSGTANGQNGVYIGNNAGNALAYKEVYNVFVGYNAGLNTAATNAGATTEGCRNTCIGSSAGSGSTTGHGSSNVFIGNASGGQYSHLNEFNGNTVVGEHAGNQSQNIGEHNTIVGYDSHIGNSGLTQVNNAVALGYGSVSEGTNGFVCGNSTSQILMGYTLVPTPTTFVVGTTTFTNSDCRLYVNPRSGSSSAAYFNGNVFVSGSVFQTSDSALKQNVEVIADSTANRLLN